MNMMDEYKLDLDEVKKRFFPNESIAHKHNIKFKLLPYVANDKNLVLDFQGVVGELSRRMSGKELKENFDVDLFINEAIERISEFDGENSKEVLKDIIRTMFIDNGKLVDFDVNTINYLQSTNDDIKIAKFLFSIFFDDSLQENIQECYIKKANNILYNLVLSSLPELKSKKYKKEEYNCYLPFIKELFLKDFKFILSNEELYRSSLRRLIEYYYMFYVSQLIVKLSKFEKADIYSPDKIYYTLEWESTSKNRTAYKFGWELLKGKVDCIYSHAITLELLNHHTLDKQLTYKDLYDLFSKSIDKISLKIEILSLIDVYIDGIKDVEWQNFKEITHESEEEVFKYVYKLFDTVEYQFKSSTRGRAYDAYKNWFVKFVYNNFAKRRGQLGYNLNMTEDDIILMTKICINNNEKMKLNKLFDEFELRGIFFDRDSKTKIVQLYEKLNLLEKKSDSGDAQYVRSVL